MSVHSPEGGLIPTELVERLEAASEGSRELDYRIAETFDIPDPWIVAVGVWPPFMPGSRLDKSIPVFSTSLDAALALAERVLGEKEAMYVLHDVIADEMANDLDMMAISDLPRILCIAILKATTASSVGTQGEARSEPSAPGEGEGL